MQNLNQYQLNTSTPEELMDYITVKHHWFTKCMLNLILQHSLKLANDGQSQALNIYEAVFKLNNFALKHFSDEEEILFPYAKKLIEWQHEGVSFGIPVINIIGNPIIRFMKEHENILELMEQIRNLTGNYSSMNTRKCKLMLLHYELLELDQDFQKQFFIEDNILFNKLLGLQKDMIISKFIRS
jgi:iron-sulfur cluster repair protein YtfE (RIC family)